MEDLHKYLDYDEGSLDFKDFKQKGIHGVAKYPAMMVAPMQEKILKDILKYEKGIKNVCDPFHGSGTTLVVANSIGLDGIGVDINPLANLITDVKLNGVAREKIINKNEKIIKRLYSKDFETHNFPNINKWFRRDIIESLSCIKRAIEQEEDKIYRKYYWVCLSNIIYKYNNSRKTTFKLHIKETIEIERMSNNVIKDFIKEISEKYEYLPNNIEINNKLICNDFLKIDNEIDKESVDLICTSPPYGDNPTTVTYGQFSILSLLWIDSEDMDIVETDLLSNYSRLDKSSLGGSFSKKIEVEPVKTLIKNLSMISQNKQIKVKSFFYDYFKALDKMVSILKNNGIMILTLGNRTVDGYNIEMDTITEEYLTSLGLSLIVDVKRNIYNKRMPQKVSNIKGKGKVKSMSQETILIFRKSELDD